MNNNTIIQHIYFGYIFNNMYYDSNLVLNLGLGAVSYKFI